MLAQSFLDLGLGEPLPSFLSFFSFADLDLFSFFSFLALPLLLVLLLSFLAGLSVDEPAPPFTDLR